ncbi:MAG: hypothetical protein CL927_12565 [Deltaproteobacteria bacterium]|nr:hypothetical protein [Deltaproteobacteria bacterium]HCH61576.1 SCO family protein [Deltaproteobacteria bacterium]
MAARRASVAMSLMFAAPALAEGLAPGGRPASDMPEEMAAVAVDEHLDAQVDLSLRFNSHTGESVTLESLLTGDIPTLLTLNYYTCETLCSLQLNAVLEGLKALDWVAGEQFRIVTVSIDPNEDPELARTKRASYLEALDKGDVEWHFLTGDQAAITSLAETVGFRYSYDEATGQFAHPAVVSFLSPEGRVARYIYGVVYGARDLKFALIESAAGRVGSPAEKLILSCFRYDESLGKYTPFAFGVMRLGGVFTMFAMGLLGIVLWRRELSGHDDGSES